MTILYYYKLPPFRHPAGDQVFSRPPKTKRQKSFVKKFLKDFYEKELKAKEDEEFLIMDLMMRGLL